MTEPSSRLPWRIAAAATVVAALCIALVVFQVQTPGPEGSLPEPGVGAAPPRADRPPPSRDGPRPSTRWRGSTAVDPSPVIPPDVLDEAVEREIQRRSLEKVELLKRRGENITFERIGTLVDELVAGDRLTEAEAEEVESLLQTELEETWEMKRAVVAGELDLNVAMADWKSLVAETDELLPPGLTDEEVARLRSALVDKSLPE